MQLGSVSLRPISAGRRWGGKYAPGAGRNGNAVDMALGIILGTAFNKVVNSIVNDILMPPIWLLISGVEFKDVELILRPARTAADGAELPAVAIRYGLLVNTLIESLIVALAVFVVVKIMNRIIRAREVTGV